MQIKCDRKLLLTHSFQMQTLKTLSAGMWTLLNMTPSSQPQSCHAYCMGQAVEKDKLRLGRTRFTRQPC